MAMFQQAKNSSVNVNTKLFSSFSDTSLLTISGWNTQLAIKLAPIKRVTEEGFREYATDKNDVISTALTIDNCKALLNGIKEYIVPAVKESKKSSVTVSAGDGNNRKVISIVTDNGDIELVVGVKVDDNGKVLDENIIRHKFNKKSYMVDYDPSTGTGTEVSINSEFEQFYTFIENSFLLTGLVAHGVGYSDKTKEYGRSMNSNFNNSQNYSTNFNNNSPAPVQIDDFLPIS